MDDDDKWRLLIFLETNLVKEVGGTLVPFFRRGKTVDVVGN